MTSVASPTTSGPMMVMIEAIAITVVISEKKQLPHA